MVELAPIGLSVYSRLEHVKRTVSALQRNCLASESNLYIFSDGPKEGDEKQVEETRAYLHDISGFNGINIIERDKNSRVDNNRNGMRMLLHEFGKMIYLEEDIVTAPKFLTFMNQALSFYQNDQRIVSITGYSPPIIPPAHYKNDIYLCPRFSAWGFGIWKDRFDKIKMKVEGYDDFVKNRRAVARFRRGGEDLPYLLESEVSGKIDALDVKIMFHQFQNNLYTLAPTVSLVSNIGMDGSGAHCGRSAKFDVDIDMGKNELEMVNNIQHDNDLIHQLYIFRSSGFRKKMKRFLKRFGLIPAAKKIWQVFR